MENFDKYAFGSVERLWNYQTMVNAKKYVSRLEDYEKFTLCVFDALPWTLYESEDPYEILEILKSRFINETPFYVRSSNRHERYESALPILIVRCQVKTGTEIELSLRKNIGKRYKVFLTQEQIQKAIQNNNETFTIATCEELPVFDNLSLEKFKKFFTEDELNAPVNEEECATKLIRTYKKHAFEKSLVEKHTNWRWEGHEFYGQSNNLVKKCTDKYSEDHKEITDANFRVYEEAVE